MSLKPDADAQGLRLAIKLDEQIDRVAKLMLKKALVEAAASYKNESSERKNVVGGQGTAMTAGGQLATGPRNVDDEVALVVGDEHRLKQIVTTFTR